MIHPLQHDQQPEKRRLGKPLLFGIALLIYVLLTMAVMFWYQDDVEQMNWIDRQVFNQKIIAQYPLKDNVTQQQVLSRLGSPDITQALQKSGVIYQLLYYRTHRHAADGITTTDECTALLFKNRILIAKADEAVAQYQNIASQAQN